MELLLIEDDIKKIDDISSFIKGYPESCSLTVKRSYQSGLREILKSNYDLILLDMSMPTFEKTENEPGGEFEKFAGLKILKEMSRRGKMSKTILITMFDDFGEGEKSITLEDMNSALLRDFPDMYLGAVYYNSSENTWKDKLGSFLNV